MAGDGRSNLDARDTIFDGEGRETLPGGDDDAVDELRDLGPGKKLGGRYLVEKLLGKGATGVVFEASHLVIGKRVALKCVYPQHAASPTAAPRFFREAKIAATVEHPNVIQVFDGGKEGEILFLAMERLHGESLGARLERGPIDTREAVEIFLAIMDGVAAVHERGVVHRDLKPDNIFLAAEHKSGRVVPKVLDFGISKLKEPGLRELTSLGTVMGTPYYMAPEQITSTRDVDARADVYSLGVMLYEALTGEVPFPDESVIDIFTRVQSGDRAPIERLSQRAPEPIVRIVDTAMRADRDRRFGSVTEMRDALGAAMPADTDQATERPTLLDEPRIVRDAGAQAIPDWVWLALGGAGVVTLVSLVVALIAIVI